MRHLNVYRSQPSKVVELIRKVCKENISTENWANYTNRIVKEQEKFRFMNVLLYSFLKIMMPTIVIMKCNKYPGTLK